MKGRHRVHQHTPSGRARGVARGRQNEHREERPELPGSDGRHGSQKLSKPQAG